MSLSKTVNAKRTRHTKRLPINNINDTNLQMGTSAIALYNRNKIDKWKNMLAESDNINVAFLNILGEIEINILGQLESFNKNINTTINEKFKMLENNYSGRIYSNSYMQQMKKKLEIILPIDNLEDFEEFDDELNDDTEKQTVLKNLFQCLVQNQSNITNDIYTLMNSMITQSVQNHYTGAGKMHCGMKKKNFSATNMFLCMEDVLQDKYNKSTFDLNLVGRISRWLSQGIDRGINNRRRRGKRDRKELNMDSDD